MIRSSKIQHAKIFQSSAFITPFIQSDRATSKNIGLANLTLYSKITQLMSIVVLLGFLFFPLQKIAAQETQSVVNHNNIRRVITNAVQNSGKKLGLLIDPRITDQIFANTIIYITNFCSIPKENCAALFADSSKLDPLVHAFLTDMAILPSSKIRSLADRLAKGRLHKAGWPSHISVNAGRVEIPTTLQTSRISLRYAIEPVVLGVGGTNILMTPGPAELLVRIAGRSKSFPVMVENLKISKIQSSPSSQDDRPGGVLQPTSSAYCWNTEHPPNTGPFAPFNSGRMNLAESETSRRDNEAPFVRQSVLTIQVEQEKGIQCGKECEIALASLFADSVATWRSGCLRCDLNAIALIATMGSYWLDGRIVSLLRNFIEKPATNLNLDQFRKAERSSWLLSPLGAGGPGVQYYVDISEDKSIQNLICHLEDTDAPWVIGAKSYLCPNGKEKKEESLRPIVRLKKYRTPCGEKAAACALQHGHVEINLSTYRYALPANNAQGEIVIGLNEEGVVLEMGRVILHEVGHWFGVPHAQVGGEDKYLDIMSEVYDEGEPCVSEHSLRMLANAVDFRWKYQIKNGGGALLGP